MRIAPTKKKKLLLSIAVVLALALTVLGIWYPGGLTNLPVLREAKVRWYIMRLNHGDSGTQLSAAYALGQIGPEAEAAIPALVKALEDEDPPVRVKAAFALEKMGPKAKLAVPNLREMLRSKDRISWTVAAQALKKIGFEAKFFARWSDVPTLIRELFDLQPSSSKNLSRLLIVSASLQEFRLESESDLANIIEALDHSSSRTRTAAAWALGRLGIQSQPAVPKLLNLLRDTNLSVSVEAADALKRIEPEAFQKVIPSLITELKEGDSESRKAAARILGNIGRDAEAAMPILRGILLNNQPSEANRNHFHNWPDGDLRKEAVEAILAIEWLVCPTLIAIAHTPFGWTSHTANFRNEIGLEEEELRIVNPLLNMLMDRGHPFVGGAWIHWSVLPVRHDQVVVLPARYSSVSALLIRANPASKEANEVIEEAVINLTETLSQNANPVARVVAARVMGVIGSRAKPAVPALLNATEDPDEEVQKAADFALARITVVENSATK